jgi:tetratricopeptide (TPR) repeat protein
MKTPKIAGFMQQSLTTNTLAIGPSRGNKNLHTTALHEYSHYLLRNRLDIALPLWFDEGLASFLSAIEFQTATVEIGTLPRGRMKSLSRLNRGQAERLQITNSPSAKVSLRQVLQADSVLHWSAPRLAAFYDWSWLITHYLLVGIDDKPDTLREYLATGHVALVDYLGMSYQDFHKVLNRHARKRTPSRVVERPASAGSGYTYRCLDAQARDYQLSLVTLLYNPQGATELLEPHLAANPDSIKLLVAMADAQARLDNPTAARRLLQHARELAPADVDVTVALANLATGKCLFEQHDDCPGIWRDAVALYREAVAADPARLDAVVGLGLSYLHSSRPGEAVNYLRVVYGAMPWSVQVNFYLGESYRLIGDRRAKIYLTNARNWAQNEIWRRLAEVALIRMDTPDAAFQ